MVKACAVRIRRNEFFSIYTNAHQVFLKSWNSPLFLLVIISGHIFRYSQRNQESAFCRVTAISHNATTADNTKNIYH